MGFVSGSSCGFSDRCIYANKKRLSLRAAGMQQGPTKHGVGVTAASREDSVGLHPATSTWAVVLESSGR